MDIEPIISGPLVPETMTHAVEVGGFNFDWALSAGLWTAILMFLVREIVEWFKKNRDRKRKLEVYRSAVKYHINRNSTAVTKYNIFVQYIEAVPDAYTIEKAASGRLLVKPKQPKGPIKTRTISGRMRLMELEMPNFDPAGLDKLTNEIGMLEPKYGDSIRDAVACLYEAKEYMDKFIDIEKVKNPDIVGEFWKNSSFVVGDVKIKLHELAVRFKIME
ncbi:hypothetical protein JS562_12170 [Agrobacterium sp. S2]|nr:hypothetical protein [Agrobacterium sp. S2]